MDPNWESFLTRRNFSICYNFNLYHWDGNKLSLALSNSWLSETSSHHASIFPSILTAWITSLHPESPSVFSCILTDKFEMTEGWNGYREEEGGCWLVTGDRSIVRHRSATEECISVRRRWFRLCDGDGFCFLGCALSPQFCFGSEALKKWFKFSSGFFLNSLVRNCCHVTGRSRVQVLEIASCVKTE